MHYLPVFVIHINDENTTFRFMFFPQYFLFPTYIMVIFF